jgi:hypothetical protein
VFPVRVGSPVASEEAATGAPASAASSPMNSRPQVPRATLQPNSRISAPGANPRRQPLRLHSVSIQGRRINPLPAEKKHPWRAMGKDQDMIRLGPEAGSTAEGLSDLGQGIGAGLRDHYLRIPIRTDRSAEHCGVPVWATGVGYGSTVCRSAIVRE